MAVWNDKWFGGLEMPSHNCPNSVIGDAQTIAEEWLFDPSFLCILTEWVSSKVAEEVLVLLCNGKIEDQKGRSR